MIFTGYHISTFISLMVFSKVLTTFFLDNCLHMTKFVSQSYSIFSFMCMYCRALFVFCTFSFVHCAVHSFSIYGFWLPLWYLQTLLKYIIHIKFKVKTYRFLNERTFTTKEMISIFQLWTFHLYVATFLHNLVWSIYLCWYDIPDLVVHIMTSLVDGSIDKKAIEAMIPNG